jgi:ribosome-binding factor A
MKPRSSPPSGAPEKAPRSGASEKASRSGASEKASRSGASDKPRSRPAAGPRSPAGPTQRQLRVAEEIRHLLAAVLLRTEFHDKDLAKAKLTISEVRISPDLKHAAVFVSCLGSRDIAPLLPALARVAPFLRAQIAPKLGLRVAPELKFLRDEALDQATRINQLLHAPEVARDLAKDA